MILVNHFLDTNNSGILIPNRAAADLTNSAASITAQSNICSNLYQINPNFILVRPYHLAISSSEVANFEKNVAFQLDWISIGDAMSVQAMLNGVPFTPTTSTAGQSSSPAAGSGGVETGTGTQVSILLYYAKRNDMIN